MTLERVRAVARCLLVLACLTAIAAPAAAQKPTFDIEGIVSDAQQGVLPGATVTLKHTATGLTRETATDGNGRYVFSSMPPGVIVRSTRRTSPTRTWLPGRTTFLNPWSSADTE